MATSLSVKMVMGRRKRREEEIGRRGSPRRWD